MNKLLSIIFTSSAILFLVGCGAGSKIVIPSYTAPKELAKLSKIETKDEFISDGAYLALFLNPDVIGAKENNLELESMLIDNVKVRLTETNFITLDPMQDGVTLSMRVLTYDYKRVASKVSLYLEVTFLLSRGSDEFLVKTYNSRKNRQSRDPSKLPTQNELASQAVKKVVKYFITDISPIKTFQLREFKSMPKGLEYAIAYAKRKNYKGAIKIMTNFKGEKDLNYYYNLAILYEAQASETESLELLALSEQNYEKCISLGGFKDELVVNAKARFDNFYELLNKTKKQDNANQALRNDRDSMSGSSDSEYE